MLIVAGASACVIQKGKVSRQHHCPRWITKMLSSVDKYNWAACLSEEQGLSLALKKDKLKVFVISTLTADISDLRLIIYLSIVNC